LGDASPPSPSPPAAPTREQAAHIREQATHDEVLVRARRHDQRLARDPLQRVLVRPRDGRAARVARRDRDVRVLPLRRPSVLAAPPRGGQTDRPREREEVVAVPLLVVPVLMHVICGRCGPGVRPLALLEPVVRVRPGVVRAARGSARHQAAGAGDALAEGGGALRATRVRIRREQRGFGPFEEGDVVCEQGQFLEESERGGARRTLRCPCRRGEADDVLDVRWKNRSGRLGKILTCKHPPECTAPQWYAIWPPASV
jgi:hypothetical protein